MDGQSTIPGIDAASRSLPRRRQRPLPELAPPVWATSRAQYRPLPCKTILNRNRSAAHPFAWTVNPYRGCLFGCPFCYARYTHAYLEHREPDAFSSRIYVKFQAPQILTETLTPEVVRAGAIAIGTATDPYQPGERRFRITRRMLQVFGDHPGLELSITTRSPLIVRDLDLLQRIAQRSRLTVNVSLITRNPSLARLLEPGAPSPRSRLRMIRTLSDAGIRTGVFVMPILPGITDSTAEIRSLLRGVARAGAAFAVADVARILGPARVSFQRTLAGHFPHLRPTYAALPDRAGRFDSETIDRIGDRFRRIRGEEGLFPDTRGRGPRREEAGPGSGAWAGSLFEVAAGGRIGSTDCHS